MVNVINSVIIVSECELQSHYYFHFWINTFGKGMNSLIPSSYELNSTTALDMLL